MNYIDCHTHTQFSVDSDANIKQMVKRACDLGLSAYAITDHCECNCWYDENHYNHQPKERTYNYQQDFENSVSAILELKEQYKGKFNLICGTEMGQATQDLEVAEKIVNDKRLDFVIASMHQIPNYDDFAFLNYNNYTTSEVRQLIELYFLEINKLCKWGKFDILAHLTYMLRYIQGTYGIDVDITPYDEIIEDSFKSIVQKSKGIEINTSGLRQIYGDTFPTEKYVKMFRQLGGEVLSIGSDAHTVKDLGKGIEKGCEIALNSGFKRLCYFVERKPVFIDIQ